MRTADWAYDSSGYGWYRPTQGDFHMSIAYDPNGHIDSMRRKGYTKTGGGGANMDDLSYTYASSPPTNRLQLVADAVGSTTLYGNDIENQTGVGGVNYVYDGSGNLIRDYQDGTQIRCNSHGDNERKRRS